MANYIEGIEINNEPHVEIDDKVCPANICSECGADLFTVGIIEALAGGYSETEISFEDGKVDIGLTHVQDFDEQWILCGKCGKHIDRSASAVIDAFEDLHSGTPEGDEPQ